MKSLLLMALVANDQGPGPVTIIVWLAFLVLILAGWWKVFEKAGKPGWAAIVPIYNVIVMLEIVGKPLWWVVLFFIPLVNFVALIIVAIEMAHCFGRSTAFGVGIAFLGFIFVPILGFGDATYRPAPAMPA
jgi:Family of unknown function (DUF5684)